MPSRKTPHEQVQTRLREAVDRTVHASQSTRSRAQDAVDDITRAAGRVRAEIEGRSPATQDDVKALRGELRALARRIEKLEKGGAAKKKTSKGSKKAPKKKPK